MEVIAWERDSAFNQFVFVETEFVGRVLSRALLGHAAMSFSLFKVIQKLAFVSLS